MRIIFIKSVFVPDNIQYVRNVKSIKSFIKYIAKKELLIDIYLIGWIKNDNNKKKILDILVRLMDKYLIKNNMNVKYLFWSENMGKIYLLKNIKYYCKDYHNYDYMIYSDHDIIFNTNNDILKCDYVKLFKTKHDNKQIMMVSFDQYLDNRHYPKVYLNKIEIDKITYYKSNDNKHIASGCFVCDIQLISDFALLKSDHVYGDEDILIGKMNNNNNYINLLSSIKIIHPFDQDRKYIEWKRNKIINILKHF